MTEQTPPGIEFSAQLSASLTSLAAEIRGQREDRHRLLDAITPIGIPAQQGTVTSGAVSIASPELWGPRRGKAWFVQRLTADGLASAPGASTAVLGTAAAPAAGATVAATASLPAGLYEVTVTTELSGTLAAAADENNMALYVGATQVTVLVVDGNSTFPLVNAPIYVTVPAAGAVLAVKAVGAATASSSYSAQIVATPAGSTPGGLGDLVTVYRGVVAPQNHLRNLTAAQPEWFPGSNALILMPGDYLTVAGSGLAGSAVTVSGDAIQVDAPLVAAYLL